MRADSRPSWADRWWWVPAVLLAAWIISPVITNHGWLAALGCLLLGGFLAAAVIGVASWATGWRRRDGQEDDQ